MKNSPYPAILRLGLTIAAVLSPPAPLWADDGTAARDQALARRINALDAEFFAAFNACDVDRHLAMVDEDLEFYHDKGGFTKGRGGMERMARERCTSGRPKLRRELVEGSLQVHPVPGHGAIQEGSHRFYVTEQDGGERLIEIARFVHVWEDGSAGWKIVRALSFDHRSP
ncbi:nuclear transport factor 2 family protein [Luteimonas sp. RD2P54]|uniref:Nuclear transport factor 2 family protein n=1 Tax=Luteimonas endophytica TaxID=3042023 RepID=A0ABT6J9G6_9GAMM|nr:nuclear transport factor 2 family protein [Luteimonas endophytica]MDH5822848.1 nuclear transport factor 2 family protein [Luteimonas endophytica]